MQSPHGFEPDPTSTESSKGEVGEGAPGSIPSQEPLLPTADVDAPIDHVPENGLRIASSISEGQRRIAASTAALVAKHFDGVTLGQNLPEDWPRERYLKVLKAEANWRSGIMSVADIARVAGVSPQSVYEWAKTYFWPNRDDLAKLTAASVRQASVIAIAMKAREAARRIREAANQEQKSEVEQLPDGVSGLDAARDARPMSAQDAAEAVVIEQATAAAAQDAVTSLYVEAISKIIDDQQQLANELFEHIRELSKCMAEVWAEWKEKNGRKKNAHELVREEVGRQVQVMRQLMGMAAQAVGLQRRVWMLDAGAGGASGDNQVEGEGDGVPVPVQRGSYEDMVRASEASGTKLTR